MIATREKFESGKHQKGEFKADELLRFKHALVRRALDLLDQGVVYFGPDDVEERFQPADNTTSGCAISALAQAHVIERCGVHKPDLGIQFGERTSKRPSRNAAKVRLYQLCSRPVAETWLEKNHFEEPPRRQAELFTEAAA